MRRQTVLAVGLSLLMTSLMLSACSAPHGMVELSDSLVAEQWGSAASSYGAHTTVIHLRGDDGELQELGTTEGWARPMPRSASGEWIRSEEGTPEGSIARSDHWMLSEDGRSIVWIDTSEEDDRGRSPIYLYDERMGKTRVVGGVSGMDVFCLRDLPKELPPHVLAFGESDSDTTGQAWVVTMSGELRPLALLGGRELHWAAYDGDLASMRRLLDDGHELDGETYWGNTPLELAVVRGHEDVAVSLIEAGASVEHTGTSVAWLSCVFGRTHVLRALHARAVGAGEEFGAGTPLVAAALAPKEARKSWSGRKVFFASCWFSENALNMDPGSEETIGVLRELGVVPSADTPSE